MSSSTVFNSDGSSEYAQLLTLEEGKVKIEKTKKCIELNNKIKHCSIDSDKFLNYDDNKINTITTTVDNFYNYINSL